MSHLPHVLAYKNKLVELGISCPEQLAQFALEPYTNAILRTHFSKCSSLGLNEDEEDRVWQQLDRWNKVTPINGAFIFQSVKTRINGIRASLITTGRLPAPFTTVVVIEGTEGVDITANEEFEILVNYLKAELVNGHE